MAAETPLTQAAYGHVAKTFIGGMSGLVPCQVVGKSGPMHTVDVYGAGIGEAPTASNQPMLVMGMNLADSMPPGTWLLASMQELEVTGFTQGTQMETP